MAVVTQLGPVAVLEDPTRYTCYPTTILTRLSEALNLTVGDIDAERMRVHVRCGKGKKDRFVTLPAASLRMLRRYWATHRHPQLLFPPAIRPQSASVPALP